MRLTIKSYYFNTDNANEKKVYQALAADLEKQGRKCFETHGGGSHYNSLFRDGVETEIETGKNLFDNQFNTLPIPGISESGLRMFDWAQDYMPQGMNKKIKRGHYVIDTSELDAIRGSTLRCHYCGHKEAQTDDSPVFCPKCIGSEYLEEGQLHLTKLTTVNHGYIKKLSSTELAERLPLWRTAQGLGKIARDDSALSKRRQKIADLIPEAEAKAKKDINNARIEAEAFTWLMDNGYRAIDNVIFYNHTQRFGFGWRNSLSNDDKSHLADLLCEFPFDYDVK